MPCEQRAVRILPVPRASVLGGLNVGTVIPPSSWHLNSLTLYRLKNILKDVEMIKKGSSRARLQNLEDRLDEPFLMNQEIIFCS